MQQRNAAQTQHAALQRIANTMHHHNEHVGNIKTIELVLENATAQHKHGKL